MILQALKEYYERKSADPESDIAPEGWEKKEIPFIIVLDSDGRFLQIEDTREGEGKKKRAKAFLVPQAVKKTSGVAANLLWDSFGYIFGVVKTEGLDERKTDKALARAPEQKNAFISRIRKELPQTERVGMLLRFLETVDREMLESLPVWKELLETGPFVSFRFSDELDLFCRNPEIVKAIENKEAGAEDKGICLVSGEVDSLSELHSAIKGVYGAQSTGANIVSFNLDAFRSFGKKQGMNAPVGYSSMFAYTTALNTLLSKDSTQRIQIGDASTIFWSAKKSVFEADFQFFFKEPEKDDPDAGSRRIKNLFESPHSGAYSDDSGSELFYVLGLAPNAARIAIRFWLVGTVSEFAGRIRQHFEDLRVIKPPQEPEFYSLWRLLVNVAVQDKSENIPPNVAGDFMRAILNGTSYPESLLQAVLRRIRSDPESRVKPPRAALIKAFLNRDLRAHPENSKKEIAMALDTEQPSVGYQLGRLFAVLEKIQEDGNPGLNATIRDRYYGAACSAPVTVFGTLMRLKNHHLAKIENRGRVVNLERLLGEITGRFNDFPTHLNLREQGRFAIGYYHQRQDFFTKKEKIEQQ